LPDLELPLFGFVYDVPAVGEVRLNITRWLAKAQGIFGISEFIRQELQRVQPSQTWKIHAVPLAAPELKNWNPKPPATRQFDFYYPAAAMPYKNHLVLFRACVALARVGWRFRLVLSGAGIEGFRVNGGFTDPKMEEARCFLHDHATLLDDRVQVLGEVSLMEVDRLYEEARSVVLPSAYEGFGFPLAEATQRGIPVICSDIPAFREQLATLGGPANIKMVPANNAVSLASAMEDFLKCPPCSVEPETATGICRWTWQDAAQRCFELLCESTMNAS
jgi:glycosyltransferase involved in cell wall biosynthesis